MASNLNPGDVESLERAETPLMERFADHNSTASPAAATNVCQPSVRRPSNVVCGVKKDHDFAKVFCADCSKFYCDKCSAKHDIFDMMSGHTLKPVDRMSADDIERINSDIKDKTCTDHEKPLNLMCKTCNKLVCTACVISKHKNHHTQELVDVAREVQKELGRMSWDHINRRNDIPTDIDQTREDICANIKTAEEAVKKTAQRIHDIINNHEKDLLCDLKRFKAKALTELDATTGEPEVFQNWNNDQEEADNSRPSESALHHIVRRPVKQDHFEMKQKLQHESMAWKFVFKNEKEPEESLKEMLGSVKLTRPVVTLGDYIQRIPFNYSGEREVSGMVVIDDWVCVTHWEDRHLWLYDMDSNRKLQLPVPNLKNPVGMTLLSSANRTVIIADKHKDGCKLHYVNVSKDLSLTHIKAKTVPVRYPSIIRLSRRTGELLVSQWGHPHFVVCNSEGDVQRRITVTSTDKIERSPWCVTETIDGYAAIMVDREENAIIQWVDQKGKCMRTYGHHGTEHLEHGQHMVTDSEGRLILADMDGNKLHFIDSNGKLSQFLLTQEDDMFSPMCVYLDEAAARLYVAHGTVGLAEVRVYKWLPKSGNTNIFQLEVDIPKY